MSPDKPAPKATSAFPGRQKPDGNRAAAHVLDDDGSDGSMPGLIKVSDASEDNSRDSEATGAEHDDKSDDEASDLGGEEQDEYDSEEEAELQDLEREAMDIASAHPEIFDEIKSFGERSNDNHLLKALGALRGKYLLNTFRIKDLHNPEYRPSVFL